MRTPFEREGGTCSAAIAGTYIGDVARWFVPTGRGGCVSRVDQGASTGAERKTPDGVAGHVKVRNSRQASTAVTAASVSWSVAVSG